MPFVRMYKVAHSKNYTLKVDILPDTYDMNSSRYKLQSFIENVILYGLNGLDCEPQIEINYPKS